MHLIAGQPPSPVNHSVVTQEFDEGFEPCHDLIFCERVTNLKSAIILPDVVQEKVQTVTVLKVGPGRQMDSGSLRTLPCGPGDRVFVTPNSGYKITIGKREFVLYDAWEILGTFPKEGDGFATGADEV